MLLCTGRTPPVLASGRSCLPVRSEWSLADGSAENIPHRQGSRAVSGGAPSAELGRLLEVQVGEHADRGGVPHDAVRLARLPEPIFSLVRPPIQAADPQFTRFQLLHEDTLYA